MSRTLALLATGLLTLTLVPLPVQAHDAACDPWKPRHSENATDPRDLNVNWTHVGLEMDVVVCVLDGQGRQVHVALGALAGAGHYSTPARLNAGTYAAVLEWTVADSGSQRSLAHVVDLSACHGTTVVHVVTALIGDELIIAGPRVACQGGPGAPISPHILA